MDGSHDGGVGDAGHDLGLAEEAVEAVELARGAGLDDLDRHRLAGEQVATAIDDPHAAPPDRPVELGPPSEHGAGLELAVALGEAGERPRQLPGALADLLVELGVELVDLAPGPELAEAHAPGEEEGDARERGDRDQRQGVGRAHDGLRPKPRHGEEHEGDAPGEHEQVDPGPHAQLDGREQRGDEEEVQVGVGALRVGGHGRAADEVDAAPDVAQHAVERGRPAAPGADRGEDPAPEERRVEPDEPGKPGDAAGVRLVEGEQDADGDRVQGAQEQDEPAHGEGVALHRLVREGAADALVAAALRAHGAQDRLEQGASAPDHAEGKAHERDIRVPPKHANIN